MSQLLISSILFVLFVGTQGIDPVVSTPYGSVEGFRYTTPSGYETEVFLGIPYAAPPIGDLRFEKSIPPTPWPTTRQAKAFGAACVTLPKFSAITASEDCLYMNIIKPAAPSSDPKGYPVMLWIYGGGFISGSAGDYPYNATADRIVAKDVVFVSINYRIAAFGFFSTADSKAPGNYGLWDQVQALKFIQKVIKRFGGNPNNVTPFGQSSGAISVSFLSLIPETRNLFKRSIDMSGSSQYGLELLKNDVQYSTKLSDVLGCSCSTNPKTCLKTKTTAEIQNGMATYLQYLILGDNKPSFGFGPRADGDLIPDIKYEKLVKRAKKRDVLMGVNTQEWYVFGFASSLASPNATYLPITPAKADNYSQADFAAMVRGAFATPEIFGNRHQEAANKIIDFYHTQTHYNSSRNFYLQIYAQISSDTTYNIRPMREAKLRANAEQKVFYYVYNYVPPSMANAYFEGAGHSRELHNLFGKVLGLPDVPLIGDAASVQSTFSNLIINFAKTGIPSSGTLQIPRITGSSFKHIEINPVSSIQQSLWTDRFNFWKYMESYGYDWVENHAT